MSTSREIARNIIRAQQHERARMGTVTSVTHGQPTVVTATISGVAVSDIPVLDHVVPTTGFGMWFLEMGRGRLLGIGSIGRSTAWTAVSFQNSWVNFGGAYQVCEYRRVNDMVQIRGSMKSGSFSVAAFNLPAGFRAPAAAQYPCRGSAGGEYVVVGTGGDISPFGSNNAVHSLGLISYSLIS